MTNLREQVAKSQALSHVEQREGGKKKIGASKCAGMMTTQRLRQRQIREARTNVNVISADERRIITKINVMSLSHVSVRLELIVSTIANVIGLTIKHEQSSLKDKCFLNTRLRQAAVLHPRKPVVVKILETISTRA
ncbi:hypothetical protein PoB_004236400 [Plakobranchus ocellatus]|uniref:Uncharacterized protein n=1 Tax=Plakobranchus ocellatus TaxID=259542 RepID=A0AAV4B716_9GAST|nr:hypothetical protein PoB_004236400 [Plakobranchus ocellatus]